jgi:hypothetical protein
MIFVGHGSTKWIIFQVSAELLQEIDSGTLMFEAVRRLYGTHSMR